MAYRRINIVAALIAVMLPNLAVSAVSIEKQVDAVIDDVISWRRDFHQHAELSNREFRTAKVIAAHLRELDLDVKTNVAKTGVVGVLRGGLPGPVLALRADMDGLPVVEKTGLPYASTQRSEYEGREVGVMHACGHDNHMAILMGAAEILAGMREQLPGTIKFIFQPAEEGAPAASAELPGPDRAQALLFDAARLNRHDLVDGLVKLGADLDATNDQGFTPLILAAYAGHGEMVSALVEAGADPCKPGDARGNTALMGVAFRGHDAASGANAAAITASSGHGATADDDDEAARRPAARAARAAAADAGLRRRRRGGLVPRNGRCALQAAGCDGADDGVTGRDGATAGRDDGAATEQNPTHRQFERRRGHRDSGLHGT